jgi:methionine-R-sulfoxide reductase
MSQPSQQGTIRRAHAPAALVLALAVLALAVAGCAHDPLRTGDAAADNESLSAGSNPYVKPSDEDLRKKLTPEQYAVTQQEATEPPFRNELWNNHEPGIYVDVVSGEPLFSSLDKFDSGTGWPSFTRPLVPDNVDSRTDYKLIIPRTEVRSKHAGSHLGHVFEDGPAPTGMRYCINSAALRFVPATKLAEEGYSDYAKLFEQAGSATGQGNAKPAGSPADAPASEASGPADAAKTK